MTNKPTYEELENRIQELEKAEQALERIFDLSPDPIGTATPDGYLIELNPAWTKILGYSKDELMSKPLFDFIHPDDVQPTKKEVERLESGKSTIFFKNRYRSKGGSYKTFEWNATASSDGMLYATARNVSEKETAEQALKESEETYRNIFKHSQVGLYRTEPATGLIIDVNDALARIAGFKDRDELLKDQWNIAEHYVDINDRLKIIEQLTTKGSFENEVALLEDRHGIQKWLRMSGTLTEKGVIEGVAENITEIKKAEDDLKGSEEKLNNMFQFADYMVCIADLQSGHFLKVSPAFTRHLGWNEEEMLSKPIIDFIHPNDIERTEETIAKQLESDDDVLQFTNRYKTKDGNFRWFEWAANPAPTEGLSYSAAYDITERVESNKALQESERLLKSIADNFPNSFLSVINEDYTIGWSGGQEFKNQGIDPNDFVGLTLENVFGENTETIRQYYDKTFAGENQEFELFINENHQLYRTVALPSNGHKRIVSVVENITERKKAEEALKESKDNFEAIVENTENAVTVIDTKGNFLYSNTNSAKNLDLKPNELNGKSIYDFFPKEFADGRVETLRKVVESKKVDSHLIETPLDGESVSFRSDMIPFRYDGKDAVLTVSTDITDIIETQNALKVSLEEKETLLHEVNHRVKNNMQVINSLLKLQSNNIKDNQIKDVLKESQSRIFAMSAIHETLHGSENLSEIDLNSYLSKVTVSIFQTYSINPDKVTLNTDIEKIPISINQASPLGLIINELISNSLKYAFSDEKVGKIMVSMKKLDDELELIVKDDGIGMPDGLDWKNSKTLGLKLVRTLVENQLDGSIDMENNNGTKFTIKFNIET